MIAHSIQIASAIRRRLDDIWSDCSGGGLIVMRAACQRAVTPIHPRRRRPVSLIFTDGVGPPSDRAKYE